MIYINENSTYLYFPKVTTLSGSKVTFTNQVTHNSFTINVTDLSDNNTFYKFDFTNKLSDFTTGQYDYEIKTINDEVLEVGIAQYGNYTQTNTKYNTNTEIITYRG